MTQLRLVLTTLIIGAIFVVSLTSCSPNQSRTAQPTSTPPVVEISPTPTAKVGIPGGRACTMEAKLCPDGSSVGRTGPNCEFSLCPGEKAPTESSPVMAPQNK